MVIQSLRDDESNKFVSISGTAFGNTGSQVATTTILCGLQSGTTNTFLPLICTSEGYLQMKGQRIEEYRAPVTSLVTAAGLMDFYTNRSINGMVKVIDWQAGNHTATGSMWVTVSGTEQVIWSLLASGTATHNIGANFTVFPKATCVSTADASLSGATGGEYSEIPVNSIIHFIGSGFGTGKSGLGLTLLYQ